MFSKRCGICNLAYVLVVIGALNWGLIGLGGFLSRDLNVVHMILGTWPSIEWIVYILVGVAGIFTLFSSKCPCQHRDGTIMPA